MRWLVFVACAALAGSALAAGPAAWPLSYKDNSTNRFIWDKRTKGLVRASVPKALAADVLDGLGGPPDPVLVEDDRYVIASACVAHMCDVKGLFWYDTRSGTGLGASYDGSTLRVGGKGMKADSVPLAARQAVRGWIAEQGLQPDAVLFVAGDGKASVVPPEQYVPPPRYAPSPGGPSYDCAKAATRIEHAICGAPALAKLDLELARQVRELRHAVATVGAQQQLRDLQRAWLQQRDAECAAAGDMAACLERQYAAQQQRLLHWLPR